MTYYWILCRSLTHAQRAAALLERKGITALISRAPQGADPRGCGHAVKVKRQVADAVQILRAAKIPIGKILKQQGADFQEVEL